MIKTLVTEIWLEGEEILWAKILPNAEMDEVAFESCFAVYKQLCAEKKRVQIIDARAFFSLTGEGKKYSAIHSPDYFIATALITKNLSARLPIKIFNKIYKHSVPFQIFQTEEEARKWLQPYIELGIKM
jgi:hypothetical protein